MVKVKKDGSGPWNKGGATVNVEAQQVRGDVYNVSHILEFFKTRKCVYSIDPDYPKKSKGDISILVPLSLLFRN